MVSLRRTIALLWLAIGIALAVWSLYWAGQAFLEKPFFAGMFFASLLGSSVGVASALGAALELRDRSLGASLLKFVAALQLAYGAVFMLLGGAEDRSYLYSLAVAGLCILSAATLVLLSVGPTKPDENAVD